MFLNERKKNLETILQAIGTNQRFHHEESDQVRHLEPHEKVVLRLKEWLK